MPISVTFTRPKTNNIVARKNISKKTHESGSSTNKSNNKKKNGNRSLSIYAHCLPPAKAFVCWQKK